ncbi:MAG TPA: hypothetical protein VFS94_05745 [Gemmatimonadales bacterium]|nr:hypothetical protein [Gemmatimonadales bacterium]
MKSIHSAWVLVPILLLFACGGDPVDPNPNPGPPPPPPPPPPAGSCASPVAVTLAVGQHTIVNPSSGAGCIQFPAAGAGGAEYLYAALSTAGQETSSGVTAGYQITGEAPVAAVAAPVENPVVLVPRLGAFGTRRTNAGFHAMLRARERVLSKSSGAISFDAALAAHRVTVPPTVGHERTFEVCTTADCGGFTNVAATAVYVGEKSAIYLDDEVPAGGYSAGDIEGIGQLFDQYLYPIDTTSFGRESDLDNNGVVVALLTDAVNDLSPNCNSDGSVILGYFYGNDLLPGNAHSNAGEIFYSLVPAPGDADCTIDLTFAQEYLGPTFIHEFQHMISFNQHVLVGGGSSEDTWLNEGLSHYAEELAGRAVPDQFCGGDCLTRFAVGDIGNSYSYLTDPEQHFLVEPGSSNGSLAERGANWLFVRWLVDQFGADLTGAAFTRQLVETSRVGEANVEAVAVQDFTTLIPEWQLANYTDDLPGFSAASERLRYPSWDFRSTFASLNSQSPSSFPRAYPLAPDSTLTGAYQRTGTLRGGSGRHVRVIQPAQGAAVTLQLTDSQGNAIGGSVAAPRIGIVRIR